MKIETKNVDNAGKIKISVNGKQYWYTTSPTGLEKFLILSKDKQQKMMGLFHKYVSLQLERSKSKRSIDVIKERVYSSPNPKAGTGKAGEEINEAYADYYKIEKKMDFVVESINNALFHGLI